MCPGRQLGETAAFAFIAAVLYAFTIEPKCDESDVRLVPNPQFATDFLA